MSWTQKITVVVLTLTLMAATAVAFSNVSLTLGNSPNVDFGSNFGGGQPATVQIHTFTMQARRHNPVALSQVNELCGP